MDVVLVTDVHCNPYPSVSDRCFPCCCCPCVHVNTSSAAASWGGGFATLCICSTHLTDTRVQEQEAGRVKRGDRVVVSQCPRLLQSGMFIEAAVVKFVVVGEAVPQNFPKHGSCMDMQSMGARHGDLGNCTPDSGPLLASVEVSAASF